MSWRAPWRTRAPQVGNFRPPFLHRRAVGPTWSKGLLGVAALLAERDPTASPTESVLEDDLLRSLRRGGLPEPERQYRVGRVYLDFAYPSVKLGLEADSRIWHGGRADVQRDSDKAYLLVGLGWRVLHFTAADIRNRSDYVEREVALACPA